MVAVVVSGQALPKATMTVWYSVIVPVAVKAPVPDRVAVVNHALTRLADSDPVPDKVPVMTLVGVAAAVIEPVPVMVASAVWSPTGDVTKAFTVRLPVPLRAAVVNSVPTATTAREPVPDSDADVWPTSRRRIAKRRKRAKNINNSFTAKNIYLTTCQSTTAVDEPLLLLIVNPVVALLAQVNVSAALPDRVI